MTAKHYFRFRDMYTFKNLLQSKAKRWLVILSLVVSASFAVSAGSSRRSSKPYKQISRYDEQDKHIYFFDREEIDEKIKKKKRKPKKSYVYHLIAATTVCVGGLITVGIYRPLQEEEEIERDIEEEEDLHKPINAQKAKADIEKINQKIEAIPAKIEDLKKSVGNTFNEPIWSSENIKTVTNNGSASEEDAMKWFCNHAKVVINEEILLHQIQPSLHKIASIVSENLKDTVTDEDNYNNGYINVTKSYFGGKIIDIEVTMPGLIKKISDFLSKFRQAYESYREKDNEYRPATNPSLAMVPLHQYSFPDDAGVITFDEFVKSITNKITLEEQLARLWTNKLGNEKNVTATQMKDSRLLVYYIFTKMEEMLQSHNNNVKRSNLGTTKSNKEKNYDKDDYLGRLLSLMERMATGMKHCHGRIKRQIFEVLSDVGLPANGTPVEEFTKIYWYLDHFKVHVLDGVISHIITGIPPSHHTKLSPKQLEDANEVHGQNRVMKLLQGKVKFPGQEITAIDEDGVGTHSGLDAFLKSNPKAQTYATNRYFESFTPKYIIDSYADYIISTNKKINNTILSIAGIDKLYYGLVYDQDIDTLKQSDKAVSTRKLSRFIARDDRDDIVLIRKKKLAYLLYRLGILRLAQKGDKNVMTVANLI